MTAPVLIPAADFHRLAARCSVAEAHLLIALKAMRAVMKTLHKSGGSPDEQRAYNHALAVLAEHGMDPGARARENAEIAWAMREAER